MQKKILVNTITFFISKLIPALAMTLINVIFSRKLTYSEYGAYQGVWSFINIAIIFTAFGLPKYILTFSNQAGAETIKKAIKISFLILLVVLIPISWYIFAGITNADVTTKVVCLILLLSQTSYLIQEAFAISGNTIKQLITINIIYACLLFLVHLLVIYAIPYKLSYCLLGITLVSVLRNIVVLNYVTRTLSRTIRTAIDTGGQLAQLFWFGINDSLQVLTKWMDKLVLLFLLPTAQYAIYFNGTFELPLIGIALMAFQTVITSFSAEKSQTDEQVIETFRSSALLMSAVLFPLFTWLFLYASPVITLLFGENYQASAPLFALSCLSLPMRICGYTVLLQIKSKGRVILTGSIIDLVLSVLLMLALYSVFNLNGLVVALVIGTYVQAAYYLAETSRIYGIAFHKILPFSKLFARFLFTFLFIFIIKKLLCILPLHYNCLLGGVLAGLICLFYLNQSIPFYSVKQFLYRNSEQNNNK